LANVPPKALTLEVTETAFLDDPAGMREALERLRAKGASIALDDFGTGHSSLANLRTLPVDYLKIDKSFVQDKKAKPIVQAVLSMAEGLGIGTIAEGVETAEQTSFLERHGCAAIQGYYYSRPIGEAPYLEFMAAKSKAGTPVPEARKVSKDPVLSWSFTFSVDYPSIDAEHKVLVALINDLHEIQPTGDSGGDLAALDSAVARLTAYVRTHFSHEESLMDLGNVPSAAKHKEQHARFVERCAAFTSHEGESGTETARRMAFFLGDWLTHHIREADLLLADELKAAWVEDPTERAA